MRGSCYSVGERLLVVTSREGGRGCANGVGSRRRRSSLGPVFEGRPAMQTAWGARQRPCKGAVEAEEARNSQGPEARPTPCLGRVDWLRGGVKRELEQYLERA